MYSSNNSFVNLPSGVEAAVYRSERDLPPFHGNLLDYHLQTLAVGGSSPNPPTR